MFTFLLICSRSRQFEVQMFISKLGAARQESGGRYIAHAPNGAQDGWIAIQQVDDAEKDFDAEELNLVMRSIADPCFFIVEGRDGKVNFSDRFVLGLDRAEEFLIDNDHGLIESAKVVQGRIREGIRWIDASF